MAAIQNQNSILHMMGQPGPQPGLQPQPQFGVAPNAAATPGAPAAAPLSLTDLLGPKPPGNDLKNPYNNPLANNGLQNLLRILQSRGRTSPGLFQGQLGAVDRDTQGNQDAIQGGLARLGLSGSGLGQALSGAAGQAGVQTKADLARKEVATAEDRMRSDLGLLLQLVLNPQMGQDALRIDQFNADREADSREEAAKFSAIGQLLGVGASLIPGT